MLLLKNYTIENTTSFQISVCKSTHLLMKSFTDQMEKVHTTKGNAKI